MIINYNPDDYEVEIKNTICEYHKKYPQDRNYAGCGCTGSYCSKRNKVKEIKENK
jgi:hypothetical protein